MSPSSDLIEDLGGRLGPDEGLWIGIVMLEVVLDGGFEFGNAFEDAAADAVSGDEAEEALNLVEPGPGSGCEVHVEARMPFEPRQGMIDDYQGALLRLATLRADGEHYLLFGWVELFPFEVNLPAGWTAGKTPWAVPGDQDWTCV